MVRRVTRRLLLLAAAVTLSACATDIDCDCPGPVGSMSFVGTVRTINLGDGDGAAGNDRVLFTVERWDAVDPSIGASSEMVVQYDGTAHYLDVGRTYAVAAANFVDIGWESGIEPRGTCSCAPATTLTDGSSLDTGIVATLTAVVAWWMLALGVAAGVAFTLARRWLWRWRHLTSDGVRAAVLSSVTMAGAAIIATSGAALLWHDRSRNGAETALWALMGVGIALTVVAFLRRPAPAGEPD
jgi:hypothetical protein